MCGIVGAAAQRNVLGILVEGLRRQEYRGYDSAGIALVDANNQLQVRKSVGKVVNLEKEISASPTTGTIGIAHTRWATHGKPAHNNAHPHTSGPVAIVHNGIIENYKILKEQLIAEGYEFITETDSEVIAHQVNFEITQGNDLLQAVKNAVKKFEGAYSLGVMDTRDTERLISARSGCPLVVGVGIEENFIASDQMALRQVTDRFIYLEEGDVAEIKTDSIRIFDRDYNPVERPVVTLSDDTERASKGKFRHYMAKEIHEQPSVVKNTLQGRISKTKILEAVFGTESGAIFDRVQGVQIVACGTSYHAGMVAKYWFEDWAGIPCHVEVASEYRYRKVSVLKDTLFVTISQSGETADTLAALRSSKEAGYLAGLTICNVPNSSLVRESDLCLMTQAGPEIGVASTKAFTTQLVALQLLVIALGRRHSLTEEKEQELVEALHQLPDLFSEVLKLDAEIEKTSQAFAEKNHALFLGRGVEYPVAMEGALKLKEISYIHAEAYPAGELKHGPLALVDSDMPIVAVAPNDDLLGKLKSNLEEVQARGGKLFVFADIESDFQTDDDTTVINIPHVPASLQALVYTLPLQLLSYHVALVKGTDVDQPRNLAKSVTVE